VSEQVQAAIRAEIADHGPIAFDRFMELALYSPGGFYDDPPVGANGHFVTSPHVHEAFAELLASGLRAMAERLWSGRSSPGRLPLVEVGAGDGTLGAQLLARLEPLDVGLAVVERAEGALSALAERFTDDVSIAESLEEVPAIRDGIVLANELLDNLPFRRVRGSGAGDPPVEIRIGVEEGELAEVAVPCEGELAALAPPTLDAGEERVVPTGALDFMGQLAAALSRGYALLIDYGTTGAGDVHGYREHRVVGDLLVDPGSTDITAGVDLDLLAEHARSLGLRVDALVTQRRALTTLGFGSWLREELDRQVQLMDEGSGMEAVRAWGGRSRATLLVDPTALGRLRWLLLATRDAPPVGDLIGAPTPTSEPSGGRGMDAQ
jgi:SAM-dependent MidA family methyltransferase